jgi:phage N-6-adenine-methyltransferase
MQSQLMTSTNSNWETPLKLFNLLDQIFKFGLDAAASDYNYLCEDYFTEEDDALSNSWTESPIPAGPAFLNPPYGSIIGKFIEKAELESRKGLTVVCLTPARTDTKWFRTIWNQAKYTVFLYGRLKFLLDGKEVGTATFPSVVSIFTNREWNLSSLVEYGKVIQLG